MFISVIICTYNRCESLKDTLDSFLKLSKDAIFNYEIIIVDNNSNDRTKVIVGTYKQKFDGILKYIFEPQQGVSYARNRGIIESKGEILVFTDDDVTLDNNWIASIHNCFRTTNCDGLGGRILPQYPNGTPGWIRKHKRVLAGPLPYYDYGTDSKIFAVKGMMPFVGANMAYKKKCFDDAGLFREDLGPGKGTMGDDTEVFLRIQKHGFLLVYCGNALVWHRMEKNRMNLRYIARWWMASGRYTARVKKEQEEGMVYLFGLPRYIFRELLENLLLLFINYFRKREFLKSWGLFFWDNGLLIEYRNCKKCLR